MKSGSLPMTAGLPAVEASRATGTYVAFLVFIVTVYSSLSFLVPAVEPLAPGKTVIAAAALALIWACGVGARPFQLGLGAGGAALYLFFGVVLLSPFWSQAPDVSWAAAGESLKYLAGFVVAANALDTPRRVRTAMACIALASLFPAVGAIVGWSTGTHLVDGRAAWLGVFGNPNFLAYHLVISTPLALALRDASRARLRWAWLAVVCCYALAILLTGSRGGTLGLAAVLILWVARSLARGRRIAVGGAAAVAIALLMTPASPLSRSETQETLSGEVDVSAQGRIDAWRTAERMVYHNPILGVGAGAFIPVYDRYAPGDAGKPRAAHNSFAMIAAEVGLPALVLFCLAIAGAMVTLGRIARRARRRTEVVAQGLQTALFGFAVCSLTGGYAFSWPLYFVLGIGTGVAIRERAR